MGSFSLEPLMTYPQVVHESNKPLVSVICPVHNREAWLSNTIESVLAQDLESFELILIDDGSSDSSVDIMRGYAKRYPQKIAVFSQENKGVSSARNLGISKARGEYLAFIDSDDLWITTKLSKQIAWLESKGWMICQTDEVWIRNNKRVNPMKKHAKRGGKIFFDSLPICIVSPSAVMLHRSLLDDVGLFDELMPVVEDYDLWLRISSKYPIGLIPEALVVKHGGHEDQLSRRYPVMDRYRVFAMRKLLGQNRPSLHSFKRNAVYWWLFRKASIIAKGAFKRGRIYDALYFGWLASFYRVRWLLAT